MHSAIILKGGVHLKISFLAFHQCICWTLDSNESTWHLPWGYSKQKMLDLCNCNVSFQKSWCSYSKKTQIHNSYFEQFCVGTIFSLYRAIYTWKGVWLCILRIMLAFCTMCVLLSTSSHHIHLQGGLKPSETERSPRSSARKRVELSYRLMWRSSRIYRFSSWVEECRIGKWICCTICGDAGSVLVCYGEERAECEGEAVSLISPSASCCHDWALFVQVRNVVIRVHSSTASWGEWVSDYDAIRSPPRWRRFGHIQQGESPGHTGDIMCVSWLGSASGRG